MRYSVISHGTIIGYTDLDIECISENLRMGFFEPTEAGRQAVLDATGVHAVCATQPIRWRDRHEEPDHEYLARFEAASARREALNLELRDETGALFPCAYMRIYDHWLEWPREDDDDPLDDPDLDPELRAMMEADNAAIEEWLKEQQEIDESEAWKYADEEPDPRYETAQYTIQVVLGEWPRIDDEPWRD
jgi:hypothetical protein